jgi:hypothetical protein
MTGDFPDQKSQAKYLIFGGQKKSGRAQTRPAIEMRKKRFEKSTEETYSWLTSHK